MLEKDAIKRVTREYASMPGCYTSKVFAITKQDGGFCMISNMKPLNKGLNPTKFKMEGIKEALALLHPRFFMAKIDIKDVYLQVPIYKPHRDLLLIHWRSKYYRFKVLPFGISIALHVFTKIMIVAFCPLALDKVTKIAHIDDILLIANTREELQRVTAAAVAHLEKLRFLLNEKKCVLTPAEIAEFLGFLFCTQTMTISLLDKKQLKLQQRCKQWSQLTTCLAQTLAQIIGNLEATRPALREALTFTRKMCFLKTEWLRKSMDWEALHLVPKSI
jgi:hypothetical protein